MTPTEFPEDAATYIAQLERELAAMPAEDRKRIVQEIGGHLAERAEIGPQMLHATIVQLGTPQSLAGSFLDDWALSGALKRGSGLRILWVILRRAWRSFAAIAIGTAGVLLYLFSGAFAVVAVMKPITPRNVGMWAGPDGGIADFGLIFGMSHSSPELLGWWVIPPSLAAAVLLWMAAGWVMKRGGRLLLRTAP